MMENAISRRHSAVSERLVLKITGTLAFTLLTVFSAHVRIPLPFTPVPMTLQTFVVPLAGGFLGLYWGVLSMLLYVGLGAAGVHVFASANPGLAFYLAPTAGYLIGYIFAAGIIGWFRQNTRSNLLLLAALVLSHAIILTCGVLGLMWNAGMSSSEAFAKGVAPFLVGDLLKLTACYAILILGDSLVSSRLRS
jgi:biotin transport system substrate-specific component